MNHLLKNKILLVGNGPSVLQHEVGYLIDMYETVVRFNNFQIKGYEQYVGQRTTIIARRACDDVRLHPADTFDNMLCFVTYCRWTDGMLQVARQVKSHYGDKCEIIGWQKCKQISQQVGLRHPHEEWASIGILAIGLLAERYGADKLVVHGFDGLNAQGQNEVLHYFDMPPKDAKYHAGIKEVEFIKKLGIKTLC